MKPNFSKSKVNVSPRKTIDHGRSVAVDWNKSMASTMNSTFTAGLSSTMRPTTTRHGDRGNKSVYAYSQKQMRPDSGKFVNRYAKFKLKPAIPVYTFHGEDSPLLSQNVTKTGTKSTIHGNESAYQRTYDSARPVAHTKGRKYCSMTRFVKNLQDNRIFDSGKMYVYRHGF